MARIRSIKPEFWSSGQIAECSPNVRLLFIGLWNFCDDGGRHPASVRRLKMEVFPADRFSEKQLAQWIEQLKNAKDEKGTGLLTEYHVNGCGYWEVTGWGQHQRVEKPYYKYPDREGKVPDSWNGRRTFLERSTAETETETETEKDIPLRTYVTGARPSDSTNDVPLDWSGFDWSTLTKPCLDTEARLKLTASKSQDRRLVIATNALIFRGVIPKRWLDEAIESYLKKGRQIGKPWAYFQQTIAKIAQANGVDLRALLKSVPVPVKRSEPSA